MIRVMTGAQKKHRYDVVLGDGDPSLKTRIWCKGIPTETVTSPWSLRDGQRRLVSPNGLTKPHSLGSPNLTGSQQSRRQSASYFI